MSSGAGARSVPPAFAPRPSARAELLRDLEERASERLWARYRDYLEGEVSVVPFDAAAASAYGRMSAQLKAEGTRRDLADLLIAAAALAGGLTLATLHVRHFSGVAGLAVEDPVGVSTDALAGNQSAGDVGRPKRRLAGVPGR